MKKLLLAIILLFSFHQSFGLEYGDVEYKTISGDLYFNEYEITSEHSLDDLYIGYVTNQSDPSLSLIHSSGRYIYSPYSRSLYLPVDTEGVSFIPIENKRFRIYVKDLVDQYEGKDTHLTFAIYEKENDQYKKLTSDNGSAVFYIHHNGKLYNAFDDKLFIADGGFVIDVVSRLKKYRGEIGEKQYNINLIKILNRIDSYTKELSDDLNNITGNIKSQSDFSNIESIILVKYQKIENLKVIKDILNDKLVRVSVSTFPEYEEMYSSFAEESQKKYNENIEQDFVNFFLDKSPTIKLILNSDYLDIDIRRGLINESLKFDYSFDQIINGPGR